MVFYITYINPIGTSPGRHFNRSRFPWGEVDLSQIFPSVIEYLYALISGVGYIDISPFIDIQPYGIAKFSISFPEPPNSKDKPPILVEYLDLIVGTVQDKDPSLFPDSHLSGLIEVSVNFRDELDPDMPYYLLLSIRRSQEMVRVYSTI